MRDAERPHEDEDDNVVVREPYTGAVTPTKEGLSVITSATQTWRDPGTAIGVGGARATWMVWCAGTSMVVPAGDDQKPGTRLTVKRTCTWEATSWPEWFVMRSVIPVQSRPCVVMPTTELVNTGTKKE